MLTGDLVKDYKSLLGYKTNSYELKAVHYIQHVILLSVPHLKINCIIK